MPLAGSEPSVCSRGRASHEDCCAAARDPTGIGRAGSELPAVPARVSPSLRNLAIPQGGREGPVLLGRPRHRRACRESSTNAQGYSARENERERERGRERERERGKERPIRKDSDGRRKSEIVREGGRDRDEEERGREEKERAPPPPPSGLLCVRPSVCSDQEDGLTGPSVWPFDTRCVDRLADDELSGTVSARYC